MVLLRSRMNRVVAVAAVLGVLGAASPALGASDGRLPSYFVPKDKAAAARILISQEAANFLVRADDRFYRRHPACRFATLPPPATRLIAGSPAQATLDLLGPLRRPATADDVFPPPQPLQFLGDLFVSSARTLTAIDGTTVTMIAGRGRDAPEAMMPRPSTVACVDKEIAEVRQHTEYETASIRAAAIGQLRDLRRRVVRAVRQPHPVVDTITLLQVFTNGSQSETKSVATVARRGIFLTGAGTDTSTQLIGLVPDGVARVDFSYPKTVGRGPDYKPFTYPSAFRATARVRQNLVALSVPRWNGDAMMTARVVWRAASGRIIRVVGPQPWGNTGG